MKTLRSGNQELLAPAGGADLDGSRGGLSRFLRVEAAERGGYLAARRAVIVRLVGPLMVAEAVLVGVLREQSPWGEALLSLLLGLLGWWAVRA